jgi:hypothetical protein
MGRNRAADACADDDATHHQGNECASERASAGVPGIAIAPVIVVPEHEKASEKPDGA